MRRCSVPLLRHASRRQQLAVARAFAAVSDGQRQVLGATVKLTKSPTLAENDHHTVDTNDLLAPSDTYISRHLGTSPQQQKEMVQQMGFNSVDELIDAVIPKHLRRTDEMALHKEPVSETAALEKLREIMSKNIEVKNFMGQGYHGTITPATIQRNLLENPIWYTSYTPYQAEIAQGRLESLLNYQTLVTELTGMDIANASLLDEGSAAAEAMAMVVRGTSSKRDAIFFVSDMAHPQTIELMKVRAAQYGVNTVVGDADTFNFAGKKVIGALVQYPDTRGVLKDFSKAAEALHSHGAQLIVSADPLALCVAKPPSQFGADIVVGSMQRFGVPMLYGGPAAAYLATSKKRARSMPGRIIGVSIDSQGDKAIRMALQTREQHIRLDKATSNICTAQALLANMSAMYAVYHGPSGLTRIARRVHALAQLFAMRASEIGFEPETYTDFFDAVTLKTDPINADWMVDFLLQHNISARKIGSVNIQFSFDETHTEEDMKDLLAKLEEAAAMHAKHELPMQQAAPHNIKEVTGLLPEEFQRTGSFLTQPIFNRIQTETDMMRYIDRLARKDLSLSYSMISLGSCTMKLNAASTLLPVTWSSNSNIHPFAPASTVKGYRQMLHELERYLCTITGFYGCSLQPCSGASGEYAGLLAIRDYQKSIGEGHRNVCILPKSAHGTNPASAAMAGMQVKWIDDSRGIDLKVLKQLAEEHADDLSCLMVTYPSTHGVYEESIQEVCQIIHDNGGQVYMDGANMNAQVGLTAPAIIGADVCHLNLHKTFAIPHGGGGPGLGPICVVKHLEPFLPSHPVINVGENIKGGQISAAPWGQGGIAVIPWMYITMLGSRGLTEATKGSVLNANYMKHRLKDHYPLYATAPHCSHEFIIDISEIRKATGIVEEDISKRLQDYGFHAPTMSWPVPHSLMIEPTESESKDECDRLCDAFIAIKGEVDKIASGEWDMNDNPLKNAPHTQAMVMADQWSHSYSRQVAAFPAPWLKTRGKHWPTVGRINNPYGDRNLQVTTLDEFLG
mmetsp:Transcript_41994/g.100960  ORF Transcript_41994/g.100960 Transcript_41994/m.100960 type:complete len:1020 (+) Transcript_41994:40-3099(+)